MDTCSEIDSVLIQRYNGYIELKIGFLSTTAFHKEEQDHRVIHSACFHSLS